MLRPELGLLNPDDVIFDVFDDVFDVPYRLFHSTDFPGGKASSQPIFLCWPSTNDLDQSFLTHLACQ